MRLLGLVVRVERDWHVDTHHEEHVTATNIKRILRENIDQKNAFLMTDDANPYNRAKHTFIGHETVVHSAGEYVRGTGGTAVHVNTAESVHALLKRGVMGTYHHWSKTGILRLLVEKDIATNQEIRLMIEQRAQLTMDEIDQTDLPGTAEERAEIELSMEKYLSDLATAFDIP